MLRRANNSQQQTFERLRVLFAGKFRFSLVGAAACREYGLRRDTIDLDIVISPYNEAMSLLQTTGEFAEDFQSPDITHRTSTQKDLVTGVPVDFLTGGIRINDHVSLPLGIVHDPLPIPHPSGFGDVASLATVIGMKLSAVISGMKILDYGATNGVRPLPKINQDVADVRELISICRLGRDFALGNVEVQKKYEEICDSAKA